MLSERGRHFPNVSLLSSNFACMLDLKVWIIDPLKLYIIKIYYHRTYFEYFVSDFYLKNNFLRLPLHTRQLCSRSMKLTYSAIENQPSNALHMYYEKEGLMVTQVYAAKVISTVRMLKLLVAAILNLVSGRPGADMINDIKT